jgi:hypothetical protein
VTPTVNTTYTVIGIDANGCQTTTYYLQEVTPCAGIENVNFSDSEIKIFPNPSSGVFNVSLKEDREVVILNMLGSVVYRSELKTGTNMVDTQLLPKGAYFLRCCSTVTKIIMR